MTKTSHKAIDAAKAVEASTKLAMSSPVELTVQSMAAAGAVSAAAFGYWYGLWTGVARKVGLTGMGAGNFGLVTMWNAPGVNVPKAKPVDPASFTGQVVPFKAPKADAPKAEPVKTQTAQIEAPELAAPELATPEVSAPVEAPKAAAIEAVAPAPAATESAKPASVKTSNGKTARTTAKAPVASAPVEVAAEPVASVEAVPAAPVVEETIMVAPVASEAVVEAPVVQAETDGTALSRPVGLAAPREGRADDLKSITGVGPKIEMVLNDLGIFHFDQIAAWSPAEVAWVDDYLKFRGRIARDNWIAQADALATGGREEYLKRFGKEPR